MRTGIIARSSVLLTLTLLMAGCGGGSGQGNTEVEAKKTLVKTSLAQMGTVENKEEFTGTIQPFTLNRISPSMGGRIDKIMVDVGDRVRRGQLLVQMDKSQFNQSEVQLENLKVDLVRYQNLYEQGGISKQQLDQLTTQIAVSQHALTNLKDNTDLVSPVDGIVTERVYDPGDMYSQADGRILTVMQLDRVKVQVNISEIYFPYVKEGMPVEVRADVYPNEAFEGKVTLVYPAIDAATRTFTTEITIPNGNMKLRAGMFSRVSLNFGQVEAVMISDVAIQKQIGSNERFVYVIKDGKANRRTVETGRLVGELIEIRSGLQAGEEVVVAGAQKLLDQTEVEVSK